MLSAVTVNEKYLGKLVSTHNSDQSKKPSLSFIILIYKRLGPSVCNTILHDQPNSLIGCQNAFKCPQPVQ